MRLISLLSVLVLGHTLVSTATAMTLQSNDIVVTGSGVVGEGLIRIDRLSGAQTLISAGSYGDFQIVDRTAYALSGDSVVAIDTQTGLVTTLTSGGLIDQASGLAVGTGGDVFVVNGVFSGNSSPGIVRIDGTTYNQSILASGADLGKMASWDLEIDITGDLVLLASIPTPSWVSRVSVTSGVQSILFDAYDVDPTGYGWGNFPSGLGVGPDGYIVAADGHANTTGIAGYDPSTGEAQLIGTTGFIKAGGWNELLNTDVALDALGTRWIVGDAAEVPIDGLFRNWQLEENGLPFSAGYFNEIQIFYASPIPEPNVATLCLVGLSLLAASKKSQRT